MFEFSAPSWKEATERSDADIVMDQLVGRRFRPVDPSLALTKELPRKVDLVDERNLSWLVQPNVVAEAIPR
jgi:predicted nucleotidyltransferase